MAMFFIKFQVIPSENNAQAALVEGAFAHCWIVESSEDAAYNKAYFYVSKYEWKIADTKTFPIKVTEADFEDRDIGLALYREAQEKGIAIAYVGWARDGKTTLGPTRLTQDRKFGLDAYISTQKKLSKKGRCLHFDSGILCGNFIEAHSIQQNGQLSAIADDGHVYAISKDIGSLKKMNGQLTLKRRGIGSVSTFRGFCGKHDNELFKPIDHSPMLPSGEQALLYAYRSICRELFVKENALGLLDSQLAQPFVAGADHELFEMMRAGTSFGLSNLRRHKKEFDSSLRAGRYDDVEYVLFTSKEKPFMEFSGLFYPDFDFLARPLQDLADQNNQLDLLTICSAPMVGGWGLLFAWHKTSSKTCAEFMHSLATVIHERGNGADVMFGMVLSNCENLAVSPAWWDGLPSEQQDAVMARLSYGTNIFAPINPDYLAECLDGACHWKFDNVHSNYEMERR